MAQEASRNPNRTQDEPQSDLTGDNAGEMQRAVREETQEAWAAPSIGVVSPAQVKGGISGGVLGAAAGAVLGGLIGLLPLFDMNVWLRVVIIGGVFAVALSTIGGLVGGFLNPDREGETGDLPGEARRSRGQRRSGHAE